MFPTEGFQPTLSKLTAVLARLRIRYHLTGGIATVAHGEHRSVEQTAAEMGLADLLAEVLDEPDEIGA
jgi:hypothetical protein